jgi:hypothetical protein
MADFQETWSGYKRVRDVYVVVFASRFLIDVVSFFVFQGVVHPRFDLGVNLVWGISLLLLGQRLWKFRCPRCNKLFAGGWKVMDKISTCLDWIFLPRTCVSCGLPKYSTDPTAGPDFAQGPRKVEGLE